MTNHIEDPNEEAGGRFCTVQPERDPEANWEVNLAKKLEEYILKICSGEIHTGNEEDGQISVNFAEAALLLQGSVQVYSRKVEYLYSLVLHTLEFISQNRQENPPEGTSAQPEENDSHPVSDKETDNFWCPDDVPVEAKKCLDSPRRKDGLLGQFVKPPANLVVLEGDCLDSSGDANELESYLLATTELYRDFILLDPCDSVAVNDFLQEDQCNKEQNSACKGSLTHKSVHSATRGTARKSSLRKGHDFNCNRTPPVDSRFETNDCGKGPDFFDNDNFEGPNHHDMDDQYSEPGNLDDDEEEDDDDPWKPLNPHEPGNLKVKPFRKVKPSNRLGVNSLKKTSVTSLFPLAKIHGTISPELTQIWETRQCSSEKTSDSKSPPLYEKLRQSLVNGDETSGFCDPADGNEEDNGFDDGGFPDFGEPDDDMPENIHMDDDVPGHHKEDDNAAQFDANEAYGNEEPDSNANLEDLCRSHLDALLASIAETEKQTELAARVSTWKQKIEHNLEEQDLRAPFDILEYGNRVLDKLSLEPSSTKAMSFTDIVKGQEKHDVARTFSALLQLVNNEDVHLEKSGTGDEPTCYSAVNPFHVRLLKHDKRREQAQPRSSKKRAKSPRKKEKPGREHTMISPQPNCKFSAKVKKVGGVTCTPEGKRRRRSQLVQPVDYSN